MKPSIHIVTESLDAFHSGYLLANLSWHWQQAGHRVKVGPAKKIDADLGILHIDQTNIPPALLPETPPDRLLLNGSVLNISKNSFSTLKVLPDDSWDGPVIIKSNLNHFGAPEWYRNRQGIVARIRRQMARRYWQHARMLPPSQYPVLPQLKDVPAWVWKQPDIMVERFLPEREGDFYCVRGWVFFGKQSYTFRQFSREPVVKAITLVKDEFLGEPPSTLEAFREAKGFNFGKFDYVEVDGETILLDINKTPVVSASSPDTPRLRRLAKGLVDFIGG